MGKNERKFAIVVSSAIAAMLCFSLYFWIKSRSGTEDAIVVIKKVETTISESTTTIPAETEMKSVAKTTKVPKTTKGKLGSSKKVKSTKNINKETSEPVIEAEILWININTADIEDFCRLPGIGEEIAGRIAEYREENGDFLNIEEIMNVNGIGEKKFENICEYIYVENPIYEIEEEPETEAEEETIGFEPETEAEETEISENEISTIETTTEMEIITEEVTSEEETDAEETTNNIFPIDLNLAEKEDLMHLPYVTERIADRILQLRDDLEGFSHTYELLYIEELDQKEVAEILEFVTVGQ